MKPLINESFKLNSQLTGLNYRYLVKLENKHHRIDGINLYLYSCQRKLLTNFNMLKIYIHKQQND